MATLIDVARKAGVSSATVSRVLNGTAVVSAEMSEKVLTVVKELGFQLNPMAQGLRKGQTNTVALLVGDIGQTHFAELTMHVQAALESTGIDLLLFNIGHNEDRLLDFLKRAVVMRLRGIVVALSDNISKDATSQLVALAESGIQIVSLGQNLTRHKIPSIVHEERAATVRSVSYLLKLGHKRIAYVGSIKRSAVGNARFLGYKAALVKAGAFHQELVWDFSYRYAAGQNAVLRALDAGLRFTGLQAGSDELAMGAVAALKDRSIAVPDEVAVVGFGDIGMGAYARPSLTTISSHPELAAQALSQLFKRAATEAIPPSLTTLQRSLVCRESG
jgi:DNA-binding LacI/PurR family transcriptional regulator